MAFASLLLWAPPALAHASLRSIAPAQGSVQRTMPPAVVLRFDEPVNRRYTVVEVTGPAGAEVAMGDPAVDGTVVRQRLGPLPRPGRYQVAYRTVSVDGHVVSGSREFTFTPAAPPATMSPFAAQGPERAPVGKGHARVEMSSGPDLGALLTLAGVAAVLTAAVVMAVRRRRHGG